MGSRRGLVITGGQAAHKKWFDYIKESFSIIVAADSGLETALELGATVDRVVGDMDSLQNPELLDAFPKDAVFKYSRDKDYTDTEIGLSALRELGCDYIGIYGGGGGRLDHLLGISTLFDRTQKPNMWVSDLNVALLISSALVLSGLDRNVVSFFPVGDEICTMRSYGLKWQLDGLSWAKGDAGISNEVVGDKLEIEMITGQLLYVGPLETLIGINWL